MAVRGRPRRFAQLAVPPAVPRVGVDVLHLAREIVAADKKVNLARDLWAWDRVEVWSRYREHLVTWRSALMRGHDVWDLHQCPRCGYVVQMPLGPVRCFRCDAVWIALEILDE